MSILKRLLLKQYIVPYVGPAKVVLGSASFYANIGTLGFSMLAAWATFIKPLAEVHAPWLSFWLFFFGFFPVGVILLLAIEFKFVIPSVFSFNNTQGYQHNSPVAQDLQKILKNQAKIMERLGMKEEE